MKTRAKGISVVAAAAVAALGSVAGAQTVYDWTNWTAGTHTWNTATNWTPSGFPQNPGDTGNIMGSAAGNLLINVPTEVSLGHLTLGATGSPATIEIGGTGGHLRFVNTGVQGGDPVANPTIVSGGVAGATNIISAPVQVGRPSESGVTLNGNLIISDTSTNSLTLSGTLQPVRATDDAGGFFHIINDLPADHTFTIAGDILLSEAVGETTVHGGLTIRGTGHTHVTGGLVATEHRLISFGQTSNADPRSTITLSGDNSDYDRETLMLRSVIYLDHDDAVGTGQFRSNTGNNNFMSEIRSTSDDRVLMAQIGIVRPVVLAGEHSLTLGNGFLGRSGSQALVNLLPEDKVLTIEGDMFLWNSNEANRNSQIDGTGRTVINARMLNNNAADDALAHPTNFFKRGTGTLTLNNTESTYAGDTQAQGGLLVFGPSDPVTGNPTWGQSRAIVVMPGAAIGMAAGSADPNWSDFLDLITPDSQGALALSAADSAMDVNFTSGPLAGKTMSLGATGEVNYTGTITPADSTYRLGGGDTLTLPNNNQLTGANSLVAANGGEVRLTGTNNYSGTTTVIGRYITTDTIRAEARTASTAITQQFYVPTTLSITSFGALGTSSDAAANLLVQGGTLKYEGPGASTNRLFTLGTAGATLDASGTGAVNYANTGALVIDPAEARTGTTNAFFDRNQITGLPSTDDLVVGMPVTGPGIPENTTITAILSPTAVQMSQLVPEADPNAGTGTVTFGPFGRTLELTGTNTGNNTLAAAIGDSASGPVDVAKTGSGTWVLSGNNTFSGSLSVEAGTLRLASPHTVSEVAVETGGRLDVTNQSLTVQDGDLGAINALVASGYANGNWNGAGINSSAAAAQAGRALGVGPVGDDVKVMFTWAGDATLDGVVNISDLSILAGNWQQTDRLWHQGDFNYDGIVNISDLSLLAGNWQKGASGGMSFEEALAMFDVFDGVVIPEPSALALVGVGLLALRRRRRA